MCCELTQEPVDPARGSGPVHAGYAYSSIAFDDRTNGSYWPTAVVPNVRRKRLLEKPCFAANGSLWAGCEFTFSARFGHSEFKSDGVATDAGARVILEGEAELTRGDLRASEVARR